MCCTSVSYTHLYGREMDRLLSTGEQVTIALMAMAFNERGQESVSLSLIHI